MDEIQDEVPMNAVKGFLAVRDTGLTNMFDSYRVWDIMSKLGYAEGCMWLIKERGDTYKIDPKKYSRLIKEVGEILSLPDKLNYGGN